MPPVKAPSNLPSLVRDKFAQALKDGDINYYPTQVTILNANSIPFQLRFSPALANKPKPPPSSSSSSTPKPPFNPFLSPLPALTISAALPNHNLVLNKFAIVPEHFILSTKEVKPQTDVLEQDDLEAVRACIRVYEEESGEGKVEEGVEEVEKDGLFAFFNCGEHSGASQAHRHIQLLPIARMRDGLESSSSSSSSSWSPLLDTIPHTSSPHPPAPSDKQPPFQTFTAPLTATMSAFQIHTLYIILYLRAVQAVYKHLGKEVPDVNTEGEAMISYNLAMTSKTLTIVPRLAEGSEVRNKEGEKVGKLALNGTLLAGTALVKNEAEWNALREDPKQLTEVLQRIGLPSKL